MVKIIAIPGKNTTCEKHTEVELQVQSTHGQSY